MSCERNQNKASWAAASSNGISRLSSKTANFLGRLTGINSLIRGMKKRVEENKKATLAKEKIQDTLDTLLATTPDDPAEIDVLVEKYGREMVLEVIEDNIESLLDWYTLPQDQEVIDYLSSIKRRQSPPILLAG